MLNFKISPSLLRFWGKFGFVEKPGFQYLEFWEKILCDSLEYYNLSIQILSHFQFF